MTALHKQGHEVRRFFFALTDLIYVECGHWKAKPENAYLMEVKVWEGTITLRRLPPTVAAAVDGRTYASLWPIRHGLHGLPLADYPDIYTFPDGSAVLLTRIGRGYQCRHTNPPAVGLSPGHARPLTSTTPSTTAPIAFHGM